MRSGFLATPSCTATLIAVAGAALVLPLMLAGPLHGSGAAAIADVAGRGIALAVVIVLAVRRVPVAVPVAPGSEAANVAGTPRFTEALALELARLQRFARPFALVNIHCDGVAALRAHAGPRAGAEMLESAAQVIGASLRRTDFSAQFDEESFGVLLPETDASTAAIVADQLRERLAQAMRSRQWQASFSVGVSIFTKPVDSVDTAVARMAELMARVRRRGRNGMLIETDGLRQTEAEAELA